MTMRCLMICTLIGLFFALTGCNGPSPSLDPQITWVFESDEGEDQEQPTLDLPFFPSDEVLKITAQTSQVESADNPIIGYQWTQEPEGIGYFVTDDQPNTQWRSPVLAPVADPANNLVPVTLSLRVRTLLGGETVKKLNLLVVPPSLSQSSG